MNLLKFKIWCVALAVSLVQLSAASASGDRVTELEYNAKSAARRGEKEKSLAYIGEAIELAKKLKYSSNQIELLSLKRTALQFQSGAADLGLASVRQLLADNGRLRNMSRIEPEIPVEIEDIFEALVHYGATSPTIEPLTLAASMCSTFPQVAKKNNDVLTYLFDWHAKHEQWQQAEQIATRGASSNLINVKGPWLARLILALDKQHKSKQASLVYERMCQQVSPHVRNSGGWHIHMANALSTGGCLDRAKMHADLACVLAGKPTRNGSYGVSEAYYSRANLYNRLHDFAKAERDARMALLGSVGIAKEEMAANLTELEISLRGQGRAAEADLVRRRRLDLDPSTHFFDEIPK